MTSWKKLWGSTMGGMQLGLDEWIVLQDTDVERYGVKELSIDEILLTNKNLIFIYDYKASLFSKSIQKVEMIPLEDIKIIDGKPQVMKIEHDNYGNVMQIIYLDGCKEFISFNDDKEVMRKWINAINKVIIGEEIIAEEKSMKDVKMKFRLDKKENMEKQNDDTVIKKGRFYGICICGISKQRC